MNLRADLGHIAAVAAMLRDLLGSDPDEQAFLDTLEGETSALDLADALILKALEDAALVEAIKAQEASIRARRQRIEARADSIRASLGALLDAMQSRKLERPLATISRRPGVVSVNITDEASVPTQLCTVKTITTPDKTAIKRLIEAGETVPGGRNGSRR